jgi:hypothetical protein
VKKNDFNLSKENGIMDIVYFFSKKDEQVEGRLLTAMVSKFVKTFRDIRY